MKEFLVSKESLFELAKGSDNLKSKRFQEIYELCIQDKVKAHNHHELVVLSLLILDFKLKQLYTKDIKFDYFFELKNFNCDEILDLYHLFRRTNYEIALTIALENDPIDEKTKVEFLVMYTNFLFIFF